MTAPTAPGTPRRAALAFIFVTVLLDILAMGIIIPVLPQLLKGFLDGSTARTVGGLRRCSPPSTR